MKRLSTLILVLLMASVPALAAAPEAGPAKNLTVRTFQLKHKTAEQAAQAIKDLRGIEGSVSITNNALVVTDTNENLKAIANLLAELDRAPQPFRVSIRLVSAGRVAAGEKPRIADEVRDLESKMALLRYNLLENIGSTEIVGTEGEPGLVSIDNYRANFKFGEYDAASDSVKLSDLKLSRLTGDQLTQLMKTTLNVKLGQTLIMGASRDASSGRALMIVISAKR